MNEGPRRVPLAWARAVWMTSHICWVAALAVSVATGRRYAAESLREFGGIGGLCDDVFANANNGPFGYGQNAAAENAMNILLLGGTCIAAALAIWSIRIRAYLLAVVNLVLGGTGGAITVLSIGAQHDSNPFCSQDGWQGVAVVAAGLLIGAVAANLRIGRRTRESGR